MKEEMPRITFITIATGRYLEFWKQQINSARSYIDSEICIEFLVLTDNPGNVDLHIFEGTSWKLKIAKVEHSEWPYPTLFKFRYIMENRHLINSDYIWHLDADMLFGDRNVHSALISAASSENIVLVQHPGFYRPAFYSLIKNYFRNPVLVIKDLRIFVKYGAIGTWDLNKKSKAYVDRKKRHKYFCGGSWGGKKSAFFKMCAELESRINLDIHNDCVAKFHDESHINWYGAIRVHEELDSSYCFEKSYQFLSGLTPKIIAVNKNEHEVWSRSD